VGDADISEEEIDKPNDEPAQLISMPEEWFEVDDALSVPPQASEERREAALTEDAAPRRHCERLHRSRSVIKVCGWATHGIFCCCPFVTKPTPRYAMVTNLNVPCVLPIKPRKSNEIKQEERDKFYEPAAEKRYEFGFPVDGIAYSARQIEAMIRQTLEVEADMMNNEEEEKPHHADLGPGAADDQPALRDQHLSQDEELHQAALGPGTPTVLQEHQTSQDEELHHAAPGPGEDDQPVLQDQQPSNITCNITQPATIPAAVARLVLNPIGYNFNVPTSHLTTQVQPSPSPRPEQENTHKMSTMYEKDMERQQTLHRLSAMPESTYQEAGKTETYGEDGNNTKNMEGETTHEMSTTHKITYKKAVQKIAPLDALFPTMRINPDSMNQQTHNRQSDVYEIAYKKNMMIKTYQEEEKDEADTENADVPGAVANTSSGLDDPQNNCVTGQTGTTDDTKMLAVHKTT
jgi:hypothetical protein